jgi:LytS/YehU family sensor histidine kinase
VTYIFNNIIYKDFLGFFYKAIFIFVFGLSFSHLLKLSIDKLGVFEKKFTLQIFYLTVLTVFFAAIGTYTWMIALIKIGIWNVEELRKSQPDVFFYQVYFYNFFPILLTISGWALIYFLVHYVKSVRKQEREKANYKYQMLELEAKALRAQMNPHFIYNCMNSIKALIQKDDKPRSVEYLTTFSKLIRTLFQNSDKKQISLYDEIETCKLYTQLESMRLNGKLKYVFSIDPNLDLKSLMVPALIIQPFIENAIWHGIVPKDGGAVNISVKGNGEAIICEVDDDGIGRERSNLNKPFSPATHESKGVHLSRQRLYLEKTLNDNYASIEIIDKVENNLATGTRVILTFDLN